MSLGKEAVSQLLAGSGVEINGPNPWDPQVSDDRLYRRVLLGGSLALGEAYMDGWWEAEDLAEFFNKVLRKHVDHSMRPVMVLPHKIKSLLMNLQSRARAVQVAEAHYDIDNELYKAMLDTETMSYTSAYWKDATTLEEAQVAKVDMLCRKMRLKKGDRVLDIGCGFGGFAKHAAETYTASVTGVSVSKAQIKVASERTAGLPVEIRFQDYRDVTGTFDHVVSIEMIEAVGYKNLDAYFSKAYEVLKDGGLFVLQVIGGNESARAGEPWLDKYIFPNGLLPSMSQMSAVVENRFVIEDVHNFGVDYDRTLVEWFIRFDKAWETLKNRYDERFYRMWKYYLLSCAGSFRSRNNQLWQIVFAKNGVLGGYESIR